jgi:hypothetical protein
MNPRTKRKNKVFEYMNRGLSVEEAYALAFPGEDATQRRMQQYKKEFKTLTLTRPEMVESAHKVIKDTLDAKVIIRGDDKIIPTYSNRLQAAAMVLDRAEPIIKINQNLNVNTELALVDLERYRNSNSPLSDQ